MTNHLQGQTSPYLLQHAENPVDWFPWGEEAFEKAKQEHKPVFLSIGYSTCHWCHVMAHESFEDAEIAEILNDFFISIKVDKEERPDIDSIYMAVCQAMTGSGGWPTSIFMTPDQKPFFAGTYFPKRARYGSAGLKELLLTIKEKWKSNYNDLIQSADEIVSMLNKGHEKPCDADEELIDQAVILYKQNYDSKYGGFGNAPKFPTPHNLLFLMQHYRKHSDSEALKIVEKTLLQMYRGGIFDHIGYGFSRYSTDKYFLVPHFEKMLYDNALLILAYSKAFEITRRQVYMDIAEKIAFYILSEMKGEKGGFYCAQDADSDGEEGRYYIFKPDEIIELLGEQIGKGFNMFYDITESGNFEGKSIPNLLRTEELAGRFDEYLPRLREYRKKRAKLHIDDKILTSWNSLMIAALCSLYRISRKDEYLVAAKDTLRFVEVNLCDGDTLFVSIRNGKRSGKGFLDDYAGYIYALLCTYDVTLDGEYLKRASLVMEKVVGDFYDAQNGGFFLSGVENEALISRPKETYDGAIPSGNSMMTYNLVRLYHLLGDEKAKNILEKQISFMSGEAKGYPIGYAMFLTALSDYFEMADMITIVREDNENEDLSEVLFRVPSDAIVRVLDKPSAEYQLLNGQTTFYVCRNHSCMPPTNNTHILS